MYFRQLGTGYGRAWGLRLSVIGCLYVCICTEYVGEGYVCMYVINHTCTYVVLIQTKTSFPPFFHLIEN